MLLFFKLLNMQKTVICISHRIHHCINIKDWWRSVRSLEYWRNLFYAVRRGGRVQCIHIRSSHVEPWTQSPYSQIHMQSSWRVPWRAVQHAIYTTVSGDTHLSISRWIIEGTPPPPCFLHRLELVVAPEYKDHVALEVRGANLFKFLFPHVVFLVTPPCISVPLLWISCFPLVLYFHLEDSFQKDFPHVLSSIAIFMHLLIATLSISW